MQTFDFYITYSSSYSLAPPISQVLIGSHLIFCPLTSLTCCISPLRGKKLRFQLSHRQPYIVLRPFSIYELIFVNLEAAVCRCFFKAVAVLKKLSILTGKHFSWSVLFIKIQGIKHLFIKKRLQYRCFPMNIAKPLRIVFI